MTVDSPAAGAPARLHVAPLEGLGLLSAEGADAAAFLHGQLTQDITGLDAAQARPAGYCSAKGRLLASFVVLRPAPEQVLLIGSADLLAATQKRLSMFVLRAKCRLADASPHWALWGVRGLLTIDGRVLSAWAVVPLPAPDRGWAIGMPSADGVPRTLVIASAGARPSWLADAAPATAEDWAWDDIQAGLPRITAATVEQFVPQMVNLELIGGVNFQKGCYPGQEVVARSQYRGTLKRRMTLFTTAADAAPATELFHDSDPGQPAGIVVNAARRGATTALLAEVKLGALAAPGVWHLGAPDGAPLERGALPYAWPAEAEGGSAAA